LALKNIAKKLTNFMENSDFGNICQMW